MPFSLCWGESGVEVEEKCRGRVLKGSAYLKSARRNVSKRFDFLETNDAGKSLIDMHVIVTRVLQHTSDNKRHKMMKGENANNH